MLDLAAVRLVEHGAASVIDDPQDPVAGLQIDIPAHEHMLLGKHNRV